MARDLVFEIGVEELPSGPLYGAIEQLQVSVPKALDAARLEYDTVTRHRLAAAPRRAGQPSSPSAGRRGPHLQGPVGQGGVRRGRQPDQGRRGLRARQGRARSSRCTVVDDENGAYVYATVEEKGVAAIEVLPALLARLAENIEWPKSQRWGSGDARFSRPVRWLLALFGGEVVPVEFAGLTAGRLTYGHRLLAPGAIEVPAAVDYPLALERGHGHRRPGRARAACCARASHASPSSWASPRSCPRRRSPRS